MRSFACRWGLAIAFMAAIFAASSIPGSNVPSFGLWDTLAPKGMHLCGYALLAASVLHAFSHRSAISRTHFIAAVCFAILYSVSEELHQSYTPGRSASLIDVGIDTAGIVIGATALYRAQMRLTRQQEPGRSVS